jgi:hypothetical protein
LCAPNLKLFNRVNLWGNIRWGKSGHAVFKSSYSMNLLFFLLKFNFLNWIGFDRKRSVTAEVAGSSPVSPVQKIFCLDPISFQASCQLGLDF